MAKRQLFQPRRLLQRPEVRRVARLEELRWAPRAIRTSAARHASAGIVRTPTNRGARSAVSHAAAQDLEARQSHANLIEKPVTEITMPKEQNVPHRDIEDLPYQSFEPKKKRQHEMERQSVPKNAVRLPELRNSVR